MLSKQAIEEFQDIYFQEFGQRLSVEEANDQALNIIRLYKTVLGRISYKEHDEQEDN